MRRPAAIHRRVPALVVMALLTLGGSGVRAQEHVFELRDRCATGVPFEEHCLEAALAAVATQGAVGLTLAGGSDHPGTASTLGRRLGSSPRVGLSFRVGGTWADGPDVDRDQELPVRGEGLFAGSLEGRIGVGVFDGFSPLPTVGGILSMDLLGSVGVALLPSAFGYRNNVGSVGLGARVGLLRESFSLPGVSVSAAHRWAGSVQLGNVNQAGQGIRTDVDPTVTSVRAVVGKDLLAVGLLAGWGWDRYSGSARILVSPPGAATVGEAAMDAFTSDRTLWFGGFSMTYLVLQVSAEAGWTRGYFDLPDRGADLWKPSDGSFFGSVALRLTI